MPEYGTYNIIAVAIDNYGNRSEKVTITATPRQISVNITPIAELNQGNATINSHEDVISRSSLKMNYRSYVELGRSSLGIDHPRYPRIKKMTNGNYIMFYHNAQSTIGASCDYAIGQNLNSWSHKGKIFANYKIIDSNGNDNERRYANCDGIVLSNGDILAVVSYGADRGYRDLPLDAGIEIRRSRDNGVTWSDPIEIYQGVNWEPYLLELPSGEIHCYFTDSSCTGIESTDTGTAMVVSNDGGNTWTPAFGTNPYYVLRTKHYKDGNTYFNNQMPCVIKLNGSNELAAALEANIGGYHISFAYSGEDGEWNYLNPDEEGPADRHDSAFSGAAPYMVQFPSGETALSYNSGSTFYIKMGDARARNFSQDAYSPFKGKGYWGTLERVDGHRLVGAMPNTSVGQVMLAEVVLNHRIEATSRSVQVDADNSEWSNTDQALFVGDRSQAQGTLRSSFDNDSVYFLVEVLDNSLSEDDYATIYISPVTDNDMLAGEALRIRVSHDGRRSVDSYNGGWRSSDADVTVSATYRGTVSNASDEDYGYIVEIAVPRLELGIKSGELFVNFSLFDDLGGEDAISPSFTSAANWIPVIGL
ncbi:hypothetical protein [Proteiniphilum propionicum]|uniref:hypothetical protein n=1 Tax=Proteiniphilum propionicum TaxID=2829812 RepID=UPI00389AFB9A